MVSGGWGEEDMGSNCFLGTTSPLGVINVLVMVAQNYECTMCH